MAYTYACDTTEIETCEPDSEAKLAALSNEVRGYAQTIERLGGLVDEFLRRCNGAVPQSVSGSAPVPPAPSAHFGRISHSQRRLEDALVFLDQRVSKLSDIG